MRNRRFPALAGAICLAACSSLTYSNPRLERIQQELNREYDLWKSRPIPGYQYHFTRFCFCGTDLQRSVIVQVTNSKLVAVTYTDNGASAPDSVFRSYFTVEGLFGQIQAAINLQADSLVVEYDPAVHYPIKIVIDQDRFAPNDELALFASDLKAKP
jgi:hypothetical protein